MLESRQVTMPVGPEAQVAGIHVVAVGRNRCNSTFRFRQVADAHVLHVILEGSGEMTVNGVSRTLGRGSLFVFHPGDIAFYETAPAAPWRYVFAVLAGPGTAEAFRLAGLGTESARLYTGAFDVLLEPILAQYEQAGQWEPPHAWQAVSVAWQVLGAVADALGLHRPPDAADRMRQARTIIERECVNGLTVASLAAALQMDRTTLFRQFKEAFGVSPKNYLDDQRLRSALALLRHTDSSIKETAYACGWPSARDFCRAFRLRFQQTPSQWRVDCRDCMAGERE